jgi:hypothetical protein
VVVVEPPDVVVVDSPLGDVVVVVLTVVVDKEPGPVVVVVGAGAVVLVLVVVAGAGDGDGNGDGSKMSFTLGPLPWLPKMEDNGFPEVSSTAVTNNSASRKTTPAVPAMACQL